MRVLLAWFVNFAWLLYAACGLGAIICVASALSQQRQLPSKLTSFERESSIAQIARYWRLAAIFFIVGVAFLAAQMVLLPRLSDADLAAPTPTGAGLLLPTPSPTPTAEPEPEVDPDAPEEETAPVEPTPIPTEPPPTPEPPTPEPAPSINVGVRLGSVAELVGYDVASGNVNTTEGVGLILYWRALEGAGALDYWVFTHLRAEDGRLIAQHDGSPVGGTRPTTGWTPGELIVDFHRLVFREEEAGYTGTATFAIGLYNPAAPEMRVPVEGGGDYIVLPTMITVSGP